MSHKRKGDDGQEIKAPAAPPIKRQRTLLTSFVGWFTSAGQESKQPPHVLLHLPDGSPALTLYRGWYRHGQGDALYAHLAQPEETKWKQEVSPKFQYDKPQPPLEPRLTTGWTTDTDRVFRYSRRVVVGVAFTPPIQQLVDDCYSLHSADEKTKRPSKGNFVFGNQYVDYQDKDKKQLSGHHISQHPDAEADSNPYAPIYSLSLGSPRRFKVYAMKTPKPEDGSRRTPRKPVVDLLVEHGDLLVMHGRPGAGLPGMQQLFVHSVAAPSQKEMQKWNTQWPPFDRRFNLTIRDLL